jgi:hypothetical protein
MAGEKPAMAILHCSDPFRDSTRIVQTVPFFLPPLCQNLWRHFRVRYTFEE